jgi:hypothetical protein
MFFCLLVGCYENPKPQTLNLSSCKLESIFIQSGEKTIKKKKKKKKEVK